MTSRKLSCAVFNCKSNNKENPSLKFFSFPRDSERFEKWVQFCKNQHLENLHRPNVRSNYKICSKHFLETDYRLNFFKLLKETAIPTVENSTSSPIPTSIHLNDANKTIPPSPNHDTDENETNSKIDVNYNSKLNDLNTPSKFTLNLKSINLKRHEDLNKSPTKKFLYMYAKKKEIGLQRLQKKYKKIKKSNLTVKDLLKPEMTNKLKDHQSLSEKVSLSTINFFISQMKTSRKKPKGRRWTIADKVLALTLYKKGPKVYRLLRSIFCLPSIRTLTNLLNKIPFHTGINEEMFLTLKQTVSKLKSHDRHCIVMFDEMSIRRHVSYDSSTDKIIGFEDQGRHGPKTSELASQALVFMLCGLVKKWKQPIAFYFASKKGSPSSRIIEHLKDVLNKCTEIGLIVCATVCDMGSSCVQAIKSLGASKNRPSFFHNGKEIITIFDPPHLIKCTRNMFKKHDVTFKVNLGSLNYEGTASWRHIEEVYERDKNSGVFRSLWKLTDCHLNPKFRKTMKVKLAAQVLSHSVAAVLMKDVMAGLLDSGGIATAHFVEFCDQLFDSLNGVKGGHRTGKELRGEVTAKSPHHKFWEEAYKSVESWKFHSNKPGRKFFVPPSQTGWLMTIKGVEKLWNVLQKFKPEEERFSKIDFMVLRSVNQDALENTFCCIRSYCGSNTDPNVSQFLSAFKTCIVNGLAYQDLKGKGNCEQDNARILNSLETLLTSDPVETVNVHPSSKESTIKEVDDPSLGNLFDLSLPNEWSSTAYVSGFIARRLLLKSTCNDCKQALVNPSPSEEWCLVFNFKEYCDDSQKLTYPREELVISVGHCATVLEEMLNHHAHQERIQEFIVGVLKTKINFDWLELYCNEHVSDVVNKICISVCKISIPWWCKKKNRMLN